MTQTALVHDDTVVSVWRNGAMASAHPNDGVLMAIAPGVHVSPGMRLIDGKFVSHTHAVVAAPLAAVQPPHALSQTFHITHHGSGQLGLPSPSQGGVSLPDTIGPTVVQTETRPQTQAVPSPSFSGSATAQPPLSQPVTPAVDTALHAMRIMAADAIRTSADHLVVSVRPETRIAIEANRDRAIAALLPASSESDIRRVVRAASDTFGQLTGGR
jgi:hypothetical protein